MARMPSFNHPCMRLRRQLVAVLTAPWYIDPHDVVGRSRLKDIDVSIGQHVVRWSDNGCKIVGRVTDRGKGFEARHGTRLP